MLINQPVSRETWRKLVDSYKRASRTRLVPEYDSNYDVSQNKRYYL